MQKALEFKARRVLIVRAAFNEWARLLRSAEDHCGACVPPYQVTAIGVASFNRIWSSRNRRRLGDIVHRDRA